MPKVCEGKGEAHFVPICGLEHKARILRVQIAKSCMTLCYLRELESNCCVSAVSSLYVLLPKLHTERSCILLQGEPAPSVLTRALRRKAKSYFMTINNAFDEVCGGRRTVFSCVFTTQIDCPVSQALLLW